MAGVDFGVKSQECLCGVLLTPPPALSSVAEEKFEEPHILLPFEFAPPEDAPPEQLDQLRVAAEKAYNDALTEMRAKAKKRAAELRKVAKQVTVVDDPCGAKLIVTRHTAKVEGSEADGYIKLRCPQCGLVTFEWRRPSS